MKERLIFHVDVNSAFLSWEAVYQLKNGASTDIRTIPAIIGGDTSLRKGVVLAKSLPAKHFGIHTGEPVTDALTKCPSLKSFRPNFPLYREYSNAFITILKKYLPADLSDDELKIKIKEILKETEPDNFGLAMKIVMAQLKGKADGQRISKLVKELLK